MLTNKTNALLDNLISEMADALMASAPDLHDERQVLRALVAAGFGEGDAIGLRDQVVAVVKARTNQTPTENHNGNKDSTATD
jgi:hypothetical protein